MALVLADRVKETSTTTGTGTLTLAGAATGFQSFAVIGNGNTCYYTITNQAAPAEWEVGIGTYTSAGTTLARTTILASSNAGSVVTLTAGTKDVFVTYPAGKAVYEDAANVITGYPITVLDNVFTLQDNLDTTKQAQFQLSTLTTATTFTYSLPIGTAGASTLADLQSVQTFSGSKTFSSGALNFGSSAAASTTQLAYGATTTGLTKTVNIGTGGLAGSTTAITVGGTAGASTTTMNGAVQIAGSITSRGLYENSAVISANYTIGAGNNALSAGPITINAGVVVTVPSGSVWVVV